jgi:hypothetical protein
MRFACLHSEVRGAVSRNFALTPHCGFGGESLRRRRGGERGDERQDKHRQ